MAIGAAGGIDLLLGAMQAHPNNGELQERACVALLSLSAQASNLVCFQFLVLQMRRICVQTHRARGVLCAAQVCRLQGRLPRGCHGGLAQPS